jgi:hypothetical protein
MEVNGQLHVQALFLYQITGVRVGYEAEWRSEWLGGEKNVLILPVFDLRTVHPAAWSLYYVKTRTKPNKSSVVQH